MDGHKMSTKLLGWALRDAPELHPDLSTGARLTLVYLADHFNEDEGAAWPSHKRLARLMGCNDRSIRRWINELIKAGILEAITRRGTSSLYRFKVRPQSPNYGSKGRTHSPTGQDTKTTKLGHKVLQTNNKPLIEPLDEPKASPEAIKVMLDELRANLHANRDNAREAKGA